MRRIVLILQAAGFAYVGFQSVKQAHTAWVERDWSGLIQHGISAGSSFRATYAALRRV